jgi:hypothetical protein
MMSRMMCEMMSGMMSRMMSRMMGQMMSKMRNGMGSSMRLVHLSNRGHIWSNAARKNNKIAGVNKGM